MAGRSLHLIPGAPIPANIVSVEPEKIEPLSEQPEGDIAEAADRGAIGTRI